MKKILLVAGFWLLATAAAFGQNVEKKVILQGFWWDYNHANHSVAWANYLTELAPRLKAMGIDAVWIPPSYKNNSTFSVGYSPFDHYDLGDKFQKGSTRTKLGTKDELLRLIAVLHANGIEVIQDVVLNHVANAGTANGAGGQDPEPTYSMQTAGGFKNFRYVCYETPVPTTGESAADYLARKGRWSKNYPNFHPHAGWNVTSGNWEASYWGPDFSYGIDQNGAGNGYGLSSNATYNPPQWSNYNRDQARNWILWYKRQTDVDGFRWDAVKHFPPFLVQDLSYNLKYLNGWASIGEAMVNFGEYVGGKTELDNWVTATAYSNGGNDKLAGTFDFGLRSELKSIISGQGSYNMSQIPAAQQNERVQYYGASNTYVHITLPFVNNHDTFRPILGSNGNYTGWDTGNEIGGHIEPNDPRLSVVYAITFAVDGNPLVFFEDLFNLGYNGNRYTHDPTSATSLPAHSDLENIIWCHQNLDFKTGVYKVRGHSGNSADHLVIERGGKALIGLNDNWNSWQSDWVDSDFAPGTVLQDYSGANGNTTRVVQNDQRVQISTPPCNGTAAQGRRGYSIWAPVGIGTTYAPSRNTETTQQWEMADDLGDRHCSSLQQGGRLPDNSTVYRNVGRIFAAANTTVTYRLEPTDSTKNLTIALFDVEGNQLSTNSGTGTLTATYNPAQTGWILLKIRNSVPNQSGQNALVRVSYTAPTNVTTSNYTTTPTICSWTGQVSDNWTDCGNWEAGFLPHSGRDVVIRASGGFIPSINYTVFCKNLTIEAGATFQIDSGAVNVKGDLLNNGTLSSNCGLLIMSGTTTQTIAGNPLQLCRFRVANASNVDLATDLSVADALELNSGKLVLNNFNLELGANSTITAAAGSYILNDDAPTATGNVKRNVGTTAFLFPVGTTDSYTPVQIQNNGSTANFSVRAFDKVYDNGGGGAVVADHWNTVRQSWEINTTSSNPNANYTFLWNATDEGSDFERNNASVVFNNGSSNWQAITSNPTTGSNPYQITATNVAANAGFFSVSDNISVRTEPKTLEKVSFSLLPNPTSGAFSLQTTSELSANLTVIIASANGEVIATMDGNLLKINELLNKAMQNRPAGIYWLKLQYEGQIHTLKLVKL